MVRPVLQHCGAGLSVLQPITYAELNMRAEELIEVVTSSVDLVCNN